MTFLVKEDCIERVEERRMEVIHLGRKETMDMS